MALEFTRGGRPELQRVEHGAELLGVLSVAQELFDLAALDFLLSPTGDREILDGCRFLQGVV